MQFFQRIILTVPFILSVSCAFNHGSISQFLDERDSTQLSVQFKNVTQAVGLNSVPSWKYGGPTVADLDNDGRYELLLGNHDKYPLQLFWAQQDNTFEEYTSRLMTGDVHGVAAGDYDRDGDNDLLVSLGGGNASNPKPPRLLRNDDGQFIDVTEDVGIAHLGARGRAVRWLDLDGDNDLDFLQINAEPASTETGPRNILFENLGQDKFRYRSGGDFEYLDAERVLITDFNQDKIPDLVAFNPYSALTLWQGQGDFQFTLVTQEKLPQHLQDIQFVATVAQSDIDNDGDMDLYIARGKTYYQIADNAVSFNAKEKRLDLRDEGNKSHDGLSFYTEHNSLKLLDFNHWPRGNNITLPVFVGRAKERLETPTDAVTVHAADAAGFPNEIMESGWYLGYIGQNQWRLEWHLSENLAWDIRASIVGVISVKTDWPPQELGVPDILLRNDVDTGQFVDISHTLPPEANDNNWGVITADFDNNKYSDFFVYRFGKLKERIPDVLMLNTAGQFIATTQHNANVLELGGHGDMGAAFDYNHDGWVDILSGDDDYGRWYLYENNPAPLLRSASHYVQLQIGYSILGTDPIGAEIILQTDQGMQFKRVESSSASHSQSLLNIVHFGLGNEKKIKNIHVKWRDGTEQSLSSLATDQTYILGKDAP